DRDPTKAFANGFRVLTFETDVSHAHRLYELTFQHFVENRAVLSTAVSWTYWNSEFTVVGLAVLWVYVRRHDAFMRFRNSILLANVIGLVGYVLVLRSPPRMIGVGFADNHHNGLVQPLANPYDALPRPHATDPPLAGHV